LPCCTLVKNVSSCRQRRVVWMRCGARRSRDERVFGCVSNHQGALSGPLREGSHESMGHDCRLLPRRLCRGATIHAIADIVTGAGAAIRSCLDASGHDRGWRFDPGVHRRKRRFALSAGRSMHLGREDLDHGQRVEARICTEIIDAGASQTGHGRLCGLHRHLDRAGTASRCPGPEAGRQACGDAAGQEEVAVFGHKTGRADTPGFSGARFPASCACAIHPHINGSWNMKFSLS